MLHTHALTTEARKLFQRLSLFKEGFYLAGGTGLALLVGHRVSLDFDLFSDKPIKKTLLKSVESVFEQRVVSPLVNTKNELTVLSVKEIFATKAYTIGRRGAYKDYVDLFVGLSDNLISLSELIELAARKYGDGFSDRLFLEQLLYLDDVEVIEVSMLGRPLPDKKELAAFFSKKISELQL